MPKRCAAASRFWRRAASSRKGRLTDIVAFELRGWELVVANLPEALQSRLQAARSLDHAAVGSIATRWSCARRSRPEELIQEFAAHGVHIVSLNPIRTTLEDYFVATVGAATPRDTSGIDG